MVKNILTSRRKRSMLSPARVAACLAFAALLSSPTPPSAHIRTADSAPARTPAPAPVALQSGKAAAMAAPTPAAPSAPAPVPAPVAVPASASPPAPTAADFKVTSVLGLEHWLRSGEYAWDDEGVPPGPIKIVVDLRARQLHAYRGGVEIGRSSIMYGDDEKPTPMGIFPILQKKRHHISNLYNAPMPYMMRLTWDGIAIHASDVRDAYATHGCVGVPDEFAALLFAQAGLGDYVMITEGWMRPSRSA
ncbi:L,D-transpeptidase family protein [Sphingosinicella rhizophila]|uniref:L,D-transpeptidase family protein n=1 Tax=Sphingosinicella rhizophila TaxID=3050082 RepID=A0ABU3Q6P7_9SPHN|nr:L,D-transpeptidase family protein [Sphingosinicella sp. GR2756]MDT9598982.1 L,D-transpeptidase family protein [Sphingosinicella sp. GR2756]